MKNLLSENPGEESRMLGVWAMLWTYGLEPTQSIPILANEFVIFRPVCGVLLEKCFLAPADKRVYACEALGEHAHLLSSFVPSMLDVGLRTDALHPLMFDADILIKAILKKGLRLSAFHNEEILVAIDFYLLAVLLRSGLGFEKCVEILSACSVCPHATTFRGIFEKLRSGADVGDVMRERGYSAIILQVIEVARVKGIEGNFLDSLAAHLMHEALGVYLNPVKVPLKVKPAVPPPPKH